MDEASPSAGAVCSHHTHGIPSLMCFPPTMHDNQSYTIDQRRDLRLSMFKPVPLCISCSITIRHPSLPDVLHHPCLRLGCVRHIHSPQGEIRWVNSTENFGNLKFKSSSTDELVAAKVKKTKTHLRTSDSKPSVGRTRSKGRWNASEHVRSRRTKNPPGNVGGGAVSSKQTHVVRR